MTVIAWDHKNYRLGYDSRMTIGDSIVSDDYEKLQWHNGAYFIGAGETYSVEACFRSYPETPNEPNVEWCSFLMFKDGEPYYVTYKPDVGFKTMLVRQNFTLGCGEAHAITALDLGEDVETAVQMAINRDVGCGGEIRTKEFIKK